MKNFKSERAAKMAYTKAENAASKAQNDANGARWALYHNADNSPRADGWTAAEAANVDRLMAADIAAWETARAVYEAATAQGFYIRSWHFGTNPTRDLIAANMD